MPKTFYIIDGHAHIYRAYFAPFRYLMSATGEPTKATFVFIQRLLNLIDQRKPDYLAMVIDHGDETVFRKEIFPEYKSNRKSRPDDFFPQEQRILSIVKDLGIPIFVKPGDKTALKLIKQYGSAENVLAHVEELKGKMKENFERFGDRIPVARQLVTLKTDVEFEFDSENCRFVGLNVEALRKHLAECGFYSL